MINLRNFVFRLWFYYRQGWGTYFSTIVAAANTLIVTYYLAIEKSEILRYAFPSFTLFALVVVAIALPLLVGVGYIHYKKSPAFSTEIDINVESNPYMYKLVPGWMKNAQFPMYLSMINMMIKISKNEKMSSEDMQMMSELQKDLKHLIDGGSVGKAEKSNKKP
jgi:hypothetical protein